MLYIHTYKSLTDKYLNNKERNKSMCKKGVAITECSVQGDGHRQESNFLTPAPAVGNTQESL